MSHETFETIATPDLAAELYVQMFTEAWQEEIDQQETRVDVHNLREHLLATAPKYKDSALIAACCTQACMIVRNMKRNGEL